MPDGRRLYLYIPSDIKKPHLNEAYSLVLECIVFSYCHFTKVDARRPNYVTCLTGSTFYFTFNVVLYICLAFEVLY